MAALEAFPIAAQRLLVDLELAIAGWNEALAGVVIVARAQVVAPCRRVAVIPCRLVGEFLVSFRFRAPLLPPGVRVLRPAHPQALADALDLLQRDRAVLRHALAHQGRVRPLEVARKRIGPAAARRHFLIMTKNIGTATMAARQSARRSSYAFSRRRPDRRIARLLWRRWRVRQRAAATPSAP